MNLALLVAGHLIGDWIVQTDYQAREKTRSWAAMAEHMLGYHATLALAMLASSLTDPQAFAILGVSLVTHAFIDRRWPVVRLLELTRSRDFARQTWGVLVVDQALHVSILLMALAILVR